MSIANLHTLLDNASPGDWAVSETDPGVVLDADGQPIAVFGGGSQDHRNAALIVALRNSVNLLLDRVAEPEVSR